MVNSSCPVCKTSANTKSTLFNLQKDNHHFNVVNCISCSHVFTYFNDEIEIQEYYDDKDYAVKDTRKSIFYKIQEREYNNVLLNIKKLSIKKQNISLLDFGAGKGLFLNFANKLGYTTKGVETSLPRAAYAKKVFNLDISTLNYEEGLIFDSKFEVVTILHVLEHLTHPKELLNKLLKANLIQNGIVVIEVPNFDSWQSKWASKHWIHLDIPRHINHFTPKYLKGMLPSNFEVIKEEYFSLHLGIIGMMQSIWNWFGYKGFLIADLKHKPTLFLMLKIVISLPFAFLLEGLASLFKKGGIARIYLRDIS